MSRTVAVIVLGLLFLTGCLSAPQEKSTTPPPDSRVLAYQALHDWLDMEQEVAEMKTEQVVAALVDMGEPEGPQQLFHFGLLNQKLQTYASWTQARDAFRKLSQTKELTSEQRQLATILERYNQSRINWHFEYRKLQADYATLQTELDESRQDNMLLKQKIQAITDLETSISTRKEQ
jgi:hypothetical protein